MKLVVVFAAFIAFCAGNAIPLIPGDNSHYVEGESRYIWMPNGDGVPVLVDLHEPIDNAYLNTRNGAENAYWLFTRSNPTNPQIIVHGDANSIWSSNYVSSKSLKVIVHGWNSNGNSGSVTIIRDAYLDTSDVNVVIVDWSRIANNINYISAANGVPSVGEFIGNFIQWLLNTAGGSWQNVHFIGFSLGAHAVGNAGRTVGGRPARVTGLDPAGPLWGGNSNALNANDGQYVEAIHTDGGLLGIFDPIGATNFYPNGGRNPQPGCWISTCSHGRAPELFASSVYTNHFVSNLCSSLEEARNNQCSGSTLNMGNAILNKQGSGLYGLTTGRSWPF